MIGSWPILVAALAISASDVKNPSLAEGIRLYDSLDYAGALQALTQALDRPSNRSDAARIHLYIGLIQHRYKLVKDAEASFTRALDFDAHLRLPRGTTANAKALFKKIQKVKVPDKPVIKRRTEPVEKGVDPSDDPPDVATATVSESSSNPSSHGSEELAAADTTEPDHTKSLPAVDKQPVDQRVLPPNTVAVRADTGPPIAGWISIGVGVAAVATGITFGLLSGKNGSDALDEPVASRAQSLHSTAVQQRTVAFVSFGVSGAALGLAAVLFLAD